MKTTLVVTALVAGLVAAAPARAELPVGASAPDFTVDAALAGKAFRFTLAQALRQGPVVVYFYPAAFTKGCTLEAHAFAEAMDDFRSLGAAVIGISGDDIEKLKDFSVSACGNKFAVGADTSGDVIRAYDAELGTRPGRANRISYVVSPQGKIIYAYSAMNPDHHVSNTLSAVRTWREGNLLTTPPAR